MDKSIIMDCVKKMLHEIDPDPLREGLARTPDRVYKALGELLGGYQVDIDGLFTSFDGEAIDQLVMVKDIEFTSLCEHHCLPFSGLAHVAYLPNGCAIGASKLPRLVLAYANRLQIQERIAEQVAHTLMEKLNPLGVAVVIEADHSCIRCRGVRSTKSSMVNSIMLGAFRETPSLRTELLLLLGQKQ